MKEITKKLSKNGFVDGNADDQNEEKTPFEKFTKNKRNFESSSNKSFVKKKKFK